MTNGPLVSFTVNGEPMGADIRVPAGEPYRARLSAEITWRAPPRLVEFVQNGEVIESRQVPAGERSFRMEKEVPVTGSCWFAVRATGDEALGVVRPGRGHSGAIYVTVGGKPVLVRRDLQTMIRWIDHLRLLLEEQNRLGPGDHRQRARQMILQARSHYEAKLKQLQRAGWVSNSASMRRMRSGTSPKSAQTNGGLINSGPTFAVISSVRNRSASASISPRGLMMKLWP